MSSIISGSGLGLYNSPLTGGSQPNLRPGQSDAVYLNTATGNLAVQAKDEYLAALGLDLALVRTYNSQGTLDGDNNDGWRLGVYRSVGSLTGTVNTSGSTVTKTYGDGHQAVFTYNTTRGLYVSTNGEGAHDTLSWNATTSQWTWTDGTPDAFEVYNSTGRLLSSRDADGNTHVYTYNASGLITEVRTANSDGTTQSVILDYTGTNLTQLRTVTGAGTETTVRYGYDTSNRLITVTVDLSPGDNSITDGKTYVTRYTYDGTSKRLASITSGDGSSVAFTYVLVGTNYQIASVTDGVGARTTYAYNTTTRTTTATNALNQATLYVNDSSNRLTRVTDALGNATNYAYDTSSNLVSITDARGRVTAYTYDSQGNLTQTRDAVGNTVTYTYDTNNRLVTETRYLVPDPDGTGSLQPGAPITTRYAYDSEGHLRFTISAQGNVTEHRYNAPGLRTASISYTGAAYNVSILSPTAVLTETQLNTWVGSQDKTKTERVDYSYDFRGNLATTTRYAAVDSAGNGIADTHRSITSFIYDQHGRLLKSVDARGTQTADANDYVTSLSYDGLGRVLTTSQWVSNTETRTTITSYDDAGNRTNTTFANGLVTSRVYNKAGDLVSTIEGNATQTFGTTTYRYDTAGRLRLTTDPTGIRTHTLYDAAGRLVASIDPTGAMTEIQHDVLGNAVKTIQYTNRLTNTQLASLVDASGNPVTVSLGTVRPAADPTQDRISFTLYDKANRPVMAISAHDTDVTKGYVTQNFYDGAGRITDTVQYATAANIAGLTNTSIPEDVAITVDAANDRHVRSFYDNDGRRLATLDGEGYLTEYQYNSTGELTHTVSYAKATTSVTRYTDSLASLKTNIGTSTDDQHTYAFYNAKGQLIAALDAEGYLTEYSYDVAGNQSSVARYYNKGIAYTGTQTVAQLRPSLTTARVTTTQYDGANQVTSVTRLPENTTTTYSYDGVGHLIRTTTAANTTEARTTQVRYDVQGRITQELSGEGSAYLATLVNPTQSQIDAVWTSYGLTHSHDTAGRRISTTDANGNKTLFYYDAANRLSYTVNALGEVSQSVYNSFGQVVDTIRYTNRVATTGLTGGAITTMLTNAVSAIASPTGTNADAHSRINYTLRGAVKQAIDGLNNATNYTYNAFGNLATQTNPITAAQTFTYDRRGFLLTTTQGGRSTSTSYDAFGRAKTTTDANGNPPTTFYYDRLGRVITVTDAQNQSRITSYDAFGRVLTQTDARGNTTTISYTDSGTGITGHHRVTVTTPEGISTTTETNAHGETVSITDGNGVVATFAYDKNGNLNQSVQDAGVGGLNLTTQSTYDRANLKLTTADANGTVTEYTYDAANRLTLRTVDPTGLALTTGYSYDGQGRVLTTTDGNGTVTQTQYDAKGQVTAIVVDPFDAVANPGGLNLQTLYTYDAEGRTLTVTQKNTVNGQPADRVTQYVYDTLGRRTQEIKDPGGLNIVTTYAYDANDNLVARTEGQGTAEARSTRYVYDNLNRLSYSVDALGGVAYNQYDQNNNLTQTTEYANPISLAGLGATLTSADIASRLTASVTADRTSRYAYDRDNRLVFTIDTLNQVTQRNYDNNGNVIQVTAYATAITLPTTINTTSLQNAVSAIASSDLDHTQRSVYDNANRAVYSIDALNQVTEVQYDKAGHATVTIAYATAITLPATINQANVQSAVNAIKNANLDRTTLAVYDKAGRLKYSVDALGAVKENHYDGVGNVRYTTAYYDAISTTTLTGAVTETQITTALNTRNGGSPQIGKDQRTEFVYDHANRLIQTIDAEQHSEYYGYDALGNKTSFTNKKGMGAGDINYTWTYQHDKLGRLTQETTPFVSVTRIQAGANGTPLLDANGQVVTSTSSEAVITRITYDALGNVRTRTEGVGLRVDGTENTQDARTTTYVYDALGRQLQTIYPQTAVYNAAGDTLATNTGASTSSVNVINNAWVRNAATNTLISTAGVSIDISQYKDADGLPLYNADSTPTSVTARVYDSDGMLVSTTTTEVGYLAQSTTFPNIYLWKSVSNWNGMVNLSLSTLPPDTYRVELEIRDTYTKNSTLAADGKYYYDNTDGTWTRTGSLLVDINIPANSGFNIAQSAVINNAWTLDATTNSLVSSAGLSTDISQYLNSSGKPLYYADSTPTSVTARVYSSNGTLVSVATTDVGYYADDGYGPYWVPVNNWNGRVNLATTPLLADNYRIELEIRDDETSGTFVGGGIDGLWVRTGTIFLNIGSSDNSILSRSETLQTLSTITSFDRFGNATVNKDVSGNYSYKVYDQLGRLKYEIDANKYVTEYSYDSFSNQVTLTRHATALSFAAHTNSAAAFTVSEVAGLLSAQTMAEKASNRTITNVYDRLNRVTETKQPAVYSFDSSSTTNPTFTASPTTRNEYNAFGQLIRQRTLINPGVDNVTGTADDVWSDTYFYYNRLGQKTADINALGYITSYQYDALGNLSQQTEYAAALTAGSWNTSNYAAPASTTTADGNSISAIGFDRTVRFDYDRLNRKVAETRVGIQYATASLTSVLGDITTRFGYDAVGNLVSTSDASGATTYSEYDVLGRVRAVIEPARMTGNAPTLPTITVEQTDVSTSARSERFVYYTNGKNWPIYGYRQSVTIGWRSLEQWGDGDVTVTVTYTEASGKTKTHSQTFSAKTALYGAVVRWNDIAPTYFDASIAPFKITGITNVKVTKAVNGKQIAVIDSAPNLNQNIALFQKPAIANTVVEMRVRAVGNAQAWTSIAPSALLNRGDAWGLDLSDSSKFTPAGRYEYQLIYRMPSDTNAYFTGEGSFTVPDATQAFVDARGLTVTTTPSAYLNGGSVALAWNSLADWGAGDVLVTVAYTYKISGVTYSATATKTLTPPVPGSSLFTQADNTGFNGTTITGLLGTGQAVTSVQVQKKVNDAWVTMYNQPASGSPSNRLVLQGDNTGVTGIVVDGQVDSLAAIAIGGGALAVDIGALKRGRYTYRLVRNGVTETATRSFEIKSGAQPLAALVQEIYGYEDNSGKFLSHLEVAGVPSGTTSLMLDIRRLGDTGPYITKFAVASATAGVFTVNDDKIESGNYEYRLKDGAGNLLSFAGSSGTFAVRRGAQNAANPVGRNQGALSPVTNYDLDIYGNVVHSVKYAFGSDVSADQHRYNQFDTFGHALRSIDAEGNTTFYSYNAAGQVAKMWRLVTNADGVGRYVVQQTTYDALGQQTASTEVLNDGSLLRHDAKYDAFGSIVARGINGGWQEYFDYDAAGRLWRTNQKDGVAKVYLFNLQGQGTAEIRSQNLDFGDRLTYANVQSVAALTSDIVRTDTVYNVLGQVVAQRAPSFTMAGTGSAVPNALRVQEGFVNASISQTYQLVDDGYSSYSNGGNIIAVQWGALDQWGSGSVTVSVDYTATTTDNSALGRFGTPDSTGSFTFSQKLVSGTTSATLNWDPSDPAVATANGYVVQSIARVRVWKDVEGQRVLVYDRAPNGSVSREIQWWKPDGTVEATLQYRAIGATAWTVASTTNGLILDRGNTWVVDLNALPSDQYEYTLSYTRLGESAPYSQSQGNFTLMQSDATGSRNLAGRVESASLDLVGFVGANKKGLPEYTDNTVTLAWDTLERWGNGDTVVTVDFVNRNRNNNTAGRADTTTISLNGLATLRGATVTWTDPITDQYGGINNITRIRVWKKLADGSQVLVHDTTGDYTGPERLILRGNTTGLTAVNISGVGTRAATSLGGGFYAVNIDDLARGSYTATAVGTSSTQAIAFEARGAVGSGVVLQESIFDVRTVDFRTTHDGNWGGSVTLAWDELSLWGTGTLRVGVDYTTAASGNLALTSGSADGKSGYQERTYTNVAEVSRGTVLQWTNNNSDNAGVNHVDRVRLWKVVDGKEILIYDSILDARADRLDVSGLPATAVTASFEYRPAGANRAYWSAPAVSRGAATGWFSVDAADIPAGRYEYRLTARDSNGAIVGTYTGATDINHANVPGSSTARLVTPTTTVTLDRWGNTISVTDPQGYKTDYRYNSFNQVLAEVKPWATVWMKDGTSVVQRPTTKYQYDYAGRVVGNTDANGNLHTLVYDAAGQRIAEHHLDSYNLDTGSVRYRYDAFGRQISKTDANDNTIAYRYDRENRVTDILYPGSTDAVPLGEHFTYDEAGQRITAANAMGETTRFYYDTQGHLIRTRSPLGAENYAVFNARGHKIRETWAGTADFMTWSYDYFGQLKTHTDLGAANFSYSYNKLGALTQQTSSRGQNQTYDYLENGQLRAIHDNATGTEEFFGYDIAGHRVRDSVQIKGKLFSDTRISYDALGRMATVRETRNYSKPEFNGYDIAYSYDAVGNRRRILAHYAEGGGKVKTTDYWYDYDSLNRILLSEGVLQNGVITYSKDQGIALGYDLAGNRTLAMKYKEYNNVKYLSKETYIYNDRNQLIEQRNEHSLGPVTADTMGKRYYDLAGRMVKSEDYGFGSGKWNPKSTTIITYNQDSQVTKSKTDGSTSTNTYDARGNLIKTVAGGTTYTYEYVKFDSYKESHVKAGGGHTYETYDVNGNLIKVVDAAAPKNNRTLTLNAAGQILRKEQTRGLQNYYYVDNKPIGSNGQLTTDNFDFNYTPVSDAYPGSAPGVYFVNTGDTLQGIALGVFGDASLWYLIADLNALSSDSDLVAGMQLRIPNQVTNIHNTADTFKPYNPAEIIGSTTPTIPPPKDGGGCGVVGQIIMVIVAIVVTIFTAGAGALAFAGTLGTTFAAGGVTAVMGAGMTAMAGGLVAGAAGVAGLMGSVAGAMIGSAVGSAVSQVAGMAMGVVDEFSWGAVATSALSAGITAGIGGYLGSGGIAGALIDKPGTVTTAVINNMANNAIGQGVNMLTGQQEKFSWASVAAAGVAAGFISKITNWDGKAPPVYQSVDPLRELAGRIGGGVGGTVLKQIAVHNGAQEWVQVAADAFGNAIGGSLVDQIQKGSNTTKSVTAATPAASTDGTETDDVTAQNMAADPINPEALDRDKIRTDVGKILIHTLPGYGGLPDLSAMDQFDAENEYPGPVGGRPTDVTSRPMSSDHIALFYELADLASGREVIAGLLAKVEEQIQNEYMTQDGFITERGQVAWKKGEWEPIRLLDSGGRAPHVTPSGNLYLPSHQFPVDSELPPGELPQYVTGGTKTALGILAHELDHVIRFRSGEGPGWSTERSGVIVENSVIRELRQLAGGDPRYVEREYYWSGPDNDFSNFVLHVPTGIVRPIVPDAVENYLYPEMSVPATVPTQRIIRPDTGWDKMNNGLKILRDVFRIYRPPAQEPTTLTGAVRG